MGTALEWDLDRLRSSDEVSAERGRLAVKSERG